MYGNGRPVGTRMRIRLLVAVVLLAWATQTLLHQWGYGAEAPKAPPAEHFVPGSARYAAGATLELRGEATIVGGDVRLRQVCRWSEADAPVFAPVADLIVTRVRSASPFRSVSIDEVRATLHDAGVNLGVIKFVGPVTCTITRSDGQFDADKALRQWADAKEPPADDPPVAVPAGGVKAVDAPQRPAAPAPHAAAASGPETRQADATPPVKTLRSLLLHDLSLRLAVPEEQLQVTFNPKDERLLSLSEPLFKFNLTPRRVRDLGEVSWDVLVVTGGANQKAVISATARAWQTQVVLSAPLAYHQVIRPQDVTERRTLADRLPDEPLLIPSQVVGQEAARDLKVGTVMTARLVDAVPLVKQGQLVTVSLAVGAVRVKTVGRAMETGTYGQAVKVRNDTTREVYEVIMTGPQEGTMGPLPGSAKLATAAVDAQSPQR